jgi:uncharacterized caspase-like protein
MTSRWVAAVLLSALADVAQANQPRIFALVVGVKTYATLGQLPGALNDARLMRDTLLAQGAQEVILLTEQDATRPAIRQAWQSLLNRSGPQDMLVFAYAGHGDRIPEVTPGDEPDDRRDEVLLLAGYDRRSPNVEQDMILDNEWRSWIAAAAPRTVVTVFDSCHSGSMTRGNAEVSLLGAARDAGLADAEARAASALSRLQRSNRALPAEAEFLPHELYLGAARDDQKVWEVRDGAGKAHGALTLAVARALSGRADYDRDGRVDRQELHRYVPEYVRQLTNQLQTPKVRFAPGTERAPVFSARSAPTAASRPLRVAFSGSAGRVAASARLVGTSPRLRVVRAAESPDLLVDLDGGKIISGGGTVYEFAGRDGGRASREDGVDDQFVGPLLKWAAVEELKGLVEAAPLEVRLVDGDRTRYAGDPIRFEVSVPAGRGYLTAFNLARDGRVQQVFPDPAPGGRCESSEAARIDFGRGGRLQALPACGTLSVREPFGADHLVVVVTRENPVALRALLGDLNGRLPPRDFRWNEALEPYAGHAVGMVSLFTEQKPPRGLRQ